MIIVSGAGIAVNFLLALLSVAMIRAADYLPDAMVVLPSISVWPTWCWRF